MMVTYGRYRPGISLTEHFLTGSIQTETKFSCFWTKISIQGRVQVPVYRTLSIINLSISCIDRIAKKEKMNSIESIDNCIYSIDNNYIIYTNIHLDLNLIDT